MRKKHQKLVHKGSHRVAANRHRHVHKGVSGLIIALWLVLTTLSVSLIANYIDNRHNILLTQGGVSIKVDSVKYDDVGSYPFVPGKGEKFVIVHIKVINNSDQVFNFAPVVQTYLTDSEGHTYGMAPAPLKDPIAAGAMQSGTQRSGSLSYLVPIGAENLSVQFKL